MISTAPFRLAAAGLLLAAGAPALAQDEGEETAKEPRRYRVGLGPQLVPSYPGADGHKWRPLVDVSFTRGDTPFEYEAPDESFGFAIVRSGGFEIGPALNYQGSRKPSDVGAPVEKVKGTVEAGAFVQHYLGESFRLRAEGRRGLGGHDGWTGHVGADFISRDKDEYVFAVGPRVTWSNGRYQRAYFGVSPQSAAATGLPVYTPDGGLQGLGATASLHVALTPRWGLYGFAQYERLVSDAGDSPLVRGFGSRDQLSGGVALTMTFGGGR
ncbi:MAG: MipA/OmpV family protein [Allosphingosinicella sp.]